MSFEGFPVGETTVRVFDHSREPDSDDASDMYVLDVFGICVLVRLRTSRGHPASQPQPDIHIDFETRPPADLAVEVANGDEAYRQL